MISLLITNDELILPIKKSKTCLNNHYHEIRVIVITQSFRILLDSWSKMISSSESTWVESRNCVDWVRVTVLEILLFFFESFLLLGPTIPGALNDLLTERSLRVLRVVVPWRVLDRSINDGQQESNCSRHGHFTLSSFHTFGLQTNIMKMNTPVKIFKMSVGIQI